MRADLTFRVSSYLTLALASLCLGFAELQFLPWVGFLIVPVLALIGVAAWAEGRWVMSVRLANLLGLLIAVAVGLWLGRRFLYDIDPADEPLLMPSSWLPIVGVLLLVLLAVKLFGTKTPRDRWTLHGMGLLQVGLGCALANQPLFGALLFAYALCALWCLAIFHLDRERQVCEPGGSAVAPFGQASRSTAEVTGRYPGFRRTVCWFLGVSAAGLLLFFLVPRQGQSAWDPLALLTSGRRATRLETGLAPQIDLNHTGIVEVNDEPALSVRAVVQVEGLADEPKVDLNPEQRWRGLVLDRYQEGRWMTGYSALSLPPPEILEPDRPTDPSFLARREGPTLPRLGQRQYLLAFTLEARRTGGLILAEPVVLQPGQRSLPVLAQKESEVPGPLFQVYPGTIISRHLTSRKEFRYQQVTLYLDDLDRDVSSLTEVFTQYTGFLCWLPDPVLGLREWTDQLLDRLAEEAGYNFTPQDRKLVQDYRRDRKLHAESAQALERAARALARYLAQSGEYTYTLDLRRRDQSLDPTLDFLFNVKQGHCARYAGALALMLRSQAIPARVVKGFRGADHQGDGVYEVRQSHAHAWVEALIWRSAAGERLEPCWLTLDPTPGTDTAEPTPFLWKHWWEDRKQLGDKFWKFFVVGYDDDQQENLAWELDERLGVSRRGESLLDWAERRLLSLGFWLQYGPWLALVPAALIGVRVTRRAWHRRAASRKANGSLQVACYARLLALLARHCTLEPGPAQTPREFGEAARQILADASATASLADVPAQVVALLYRVRFGRQPLASEEGEGMDRRLDELAAALLEP